MDCIPRALSGFQVCSANERAEQQITGQRLGLGSPPQSPLFQVCQWLDQSHGGRHRLGDAVQCCFLPVPSVPGEGGQTSGGSRVGPLSPRPCSQSPCSISSITPSRATSISYKYPQCTMPSREFVAAAVIPLMLQMLGVWGGRDGWDARLSSCVSELVCTRPCPHFRLPPRGRSVGA